jgi:hypothetical protein
MNAGAESTPDERGRAGPSFAREHPVKWKPRTIEARTMDTPTPVLQDISRLYGMRIEAPDGDLGRVLDFYFDDLTWTIRYLVAGAGFWMSGHRVLLSPHAFGVHALEESDASGDILRTSLTRTQIAEGPTLDSQRPLSRQFEERYHQHFGWPAYWTDAGLSGIARLPVVSPPHPRGGPSHDGNGRPHDARLRSTRSVTGYRIQAIDGSIGAVNSFLMDGLNWAIDEVIVDTSHWYAGRRVRIRSEAIDHISCDDSTVFVNLAREDLQRAAGHSGPVSRRAPAPERGPRIHPSATRQSGHVMAQAG